MHLINNLISDYNYISKNEIEYIFQEIKNIDLNSFLNLFVINDMNLDEANMLLLANYDIHAIKEIIRLIFKNISNIRGRINFNDFNELLCNFILMTKKNKNIIDDISISHILNSIIVTFFNTFLISLIEYYKYYKIYDYNTLKLWLICSKQIQHSINLHLNLKKKMIL